MKPVSVALDGQTLAVLDRWAERWRCSRSQVVRFLALQADAADPQLRLFDVGSGPAGDDVGRRRRGRRSSGRDQKEKQGQR